MHCVHSTFACAYPRARAHDAHTYARTRKPHAHSKDTRTHKAHVDTSHSPYFGCRIAAEALKKKEPGLLFEPFFRSRTKRKEKPLIDEGKRQKGGRREWGTCGEEELGKGARGKETEEKREPRKKLTSEDRKGRNGKKQPKPRKD